LRLLGPALTLGGPASSRSRAIAVGEGCLSEKGPRKRHVGEARFPVRVDVQAKATASAKLDVRAKVPTKSVGRVVDALTDMFRPFSEARGLKADMIRLQREEVAIEIARRATERIAIEGGSPNAVPTKLLIPLIERSSQEEISDETMLDRWANLLASASLSDSVHPRYVQILSELTSSQVRFLHALMLLEAEQWENPYRCFVDAPAMITLSFERDLQFVVSGYEFKSEEDAIRMLADVYTSPGSILRFGVVYGTHVIWDMYDTIPFSPETSFDIEVCISLGLLGEHQGAAWTNIKGVEAEIGYNYVRVTHLGAAFLEACDRPAVLELQRLQSRDKRVKRRDPERLVDLRLKSRFKHSNQFL
jgi:hypothetical protein